MELKDVEEKGILVVHRRGLPVTKDDSPPVIVMISGLPDSADTWNAFAKHFYSEFHVVTMAYPFIDRDSLPVDQKWGFTAAEVTTALLAVIQEYRSLGCSKIYLIGHDWGSMAALMYTQEYPETITKAVFEDVGLLDPKQNSLGQMLVIMCYQIFLIVLFILTRFVPGTWWYKMIIHCYPWKSCGPLTIDDLPLSLIDETPDKLYPCYQSIKLSITDPDRAMPKFSTIPQLFVYGAKKRAMFHSQFYLDLLDETDGCGYKEYSDAGHWIHVTNSDEMATDVIKFFES